MDSLKRRVQRAEERAQPNNKAVLRWPMRDGTFIEVHGVRSLADVAALCRARERQRENGDGPCID
jgi:hypothetical protein